MNEKNVVDIKEKVNVDLHNAVAIAGFAEAGLVGTIAVSHVIQELNMKEVAYFSSRLIPSFTLFIDGLLKYPLRIYVNDEATLVAIVSEVPLPSDSYFDISKALIDWLESKSVNEITVLAGVNMGHSTGKPPVYAAAEPEIMKRLQSQGIEMLQRGLIAGVSASILNQCIHRDIIGLCLLAPTTEEDVPNPEASASLIESINKLYNFNISVEKLLKEAQIIQRKRREVAEAMKNKMQTDAAKRLYL